MVSITNVGKVPIRNQKQQWNKDNIQILVLSLYLGWSRSGWAPRSSRTSRNTWSQRASRKHRQRWATGPPRRAGETLAFYLTWSFVPVSVLSSLILQLLWLIWVTLWRRPGAASHWAEPYSVGFRYIAFDSTFVFLADTPISVTWFQKYIDCLKVQ